MASKDTQIALKELREEITFHKNSLKLSIENPMAYNIREMLAGGPLMDPTEAVRIKVR